MEIIWLGRSCFRIKGKEAAILTDPYDEAANSLMGENIVMLSQGEVTERSWKGTEENVRVIQGPGEYEIANVLINGFRTLSKSKEEVGKKNTAYLIEMDGVTLCHMGEAESPLTSEQVTGDIDILFASVGYPSTLKATLEMVNLIEPKVVIPMQYKTVSSTEELQALEVFLKEMGIKEIEPQPKLTVTPSTLPLEPKKVMILAYSP